MTPTTIAGQTAPKPGTGTLTMINRATHATTPPDIDRFRIAALSLRSVQGLPAVPDLKKVTADASGFVALTPEGMAGTSQDLPAAEAADAGVLPCSSAFVVRSDT